jgi:hypothetical protein
MAEIYIETENYRRAVAAIAALTNADPDDIKIALGEHASVWPESIRRDDRS